MACGTGRRAGGLTSPLPGRRGGGARSTPSGSVWCWGDRLSGSGGAPRARRTPGYCLRALQARWCGSGRSEGVPASGGGGMGGRGVGQEKGGSAAAGWARGEGEQENGGAGERRRGGATRCGGGRSVGGPLPYGRGSVGVVGGEIDGSSSASLRARLCSARLC